VKAPPNVIGAMRRMPVLRNPMQRRVLFGILVLVFLVLTLYPERYRAAMSMTPTDPESLGLSSALGESGAVNSVFGNQAAVEVVLKVGKSRITRLEVIRRLHLVDKLHLTDERAADRWLERAVYLRSLRGGIISIESWQRDPDLAKSLVGTMADAIRDQLALVARRQTAYKRSVLTVLLKDAQSRLDDAQARYDAFRELTRYAQPAAAIAAIGSRVALLKDLIRGKETQLYAARQFATDDNLSVKQIIAEMASLKVQLKAAETLDKDKLDSVGDVVEKSTKIKELERVLVIAHNRHDNYERLLEGTMVERVAEKAVVRILEPPFVDSDRQYNLLPLALAILTAMLALAIEFYGMRLPVGERAGEAA